MSRADDIEYHKYVAGWANKMEKEYEEKIKEIKSNKIDISDNEIDSFMTDKIVMKKIAQLGLFDRELVDIFQIKCMECSLDKAKWKQLTQMVRFGKNIDLLDELLVLRKNLMIKN